MRDFSLPTLMSKSYILPHVGELLEAVNVEYRAMLGPAAVDPAQRQRITSADQHQIIIGYVLEFPKGLSTRWVCYCGTCAGCHCAEKKWGMFQKSCRSCRAPGARLIPKRAWPDSMHRRIMSRYGTTGARRCGAGHQACQKKKKKKKKKKA